MIPNTHNTARGAVALMAATSVATEAHYAQMVDIVTILSTNVQYEPDVAYIQAVEATFEWDGEVQEDLMRALTMVACIQRVPIHLASEKFFNARVTAAHLKIIALEAGC